MLKVHLADSENGPPGLPKSIKRKLNKQFPGSVKISHLSAGLLYRLLGTDLTELIVVGLHFKSQRQTRRRSFNDSR